MHFLKLLLLLKKKKIVYSLLLVVYVPWVDYSKWEMWCLGGVVVRSDDLFEKILGKLSFSKKFFLESA